MKPANVLLSIKGNDQNVKLSGFTASSQALMRKNQYGRAIQSISSMGKDIFVTGAPVVDIIL
jgi:hypothetical protein